MTANLEKVDIVNELTYLNQVNLKSKAFNRLTNSRNKLKHIITENHLARKSEKTQIERNKEKYKIN